MVDLDLRGLCRQEQASVPDEHSQLLAKIAALVLALALEYPLSFQLLRHTGLSLPERGNEDAAGIRHALVNLKQEEGTQIEGDCGREEQMVVNQSHLHSD